MAMDNYRFSIGNVSVEVRQQSAGSPARIVIGTDHQEERVVLGVTLVGQDQPEIELLERIDERPEPPPRMPEP